MVEGEKEFNLVDYVNMLKNRKKFILIFTIIFAILIISMIFFLKFRSLEDATSVISLGGEKGDRSLIMKYKIILESPNVIEPVMEQYLDEPTSFNLFKNRYVKVDFIQERIHRTKESLVSFLTLKTYGDTYNDAKELNDLVVESFFNIADTPKLNNITLEKINVLDKKRDDLTLDIEKVEQVIFENALDSQTANELIEKLIDQVNYYEDFLDDVGQKAYITLDYYPLLLRKLETDLGRFEKTVLEAEEMDWHTEDREESTSELIYELRKYQNYLNSANLSSIKVNEFITMQLRLEGAVTNYRLQMNLNASKEEFTGKQAFDKLIQLRNDLKKAQFEKLDFLGELNDNEEIFSVISSPNLPSGITRPFVSESVISVSDVEDDFYAILEAKNIIQGSEVLQPVIKRNYGEDMSLEDFMPYLTISKIDMVKEGRETVITPFLRVRVSADSAQLAKKLNQEVIDSFFNYIRNFKHSNDDEGLILEKISFKEDEIEQIESDVRIFENDLYNNDNYKTRDIRSITLKLILSDLKKQLADATEERITLQSDLNLLGNFGVVSSPQVINVEESERFAPNQRDFFRIGISFIAGLFLAIFLIITYEVKVPEWKNKFEEITGKKIETKKEVIKLSPKNVEKKIVKIKPIKKEKIKTVKVKPIPIVKKVIPKKEEEIVLPKFKYSKTKSLNLDVNHLFKKYGKLKNEGDGIKEEQELTKKDEQRLVKKIKKINNL